MFMSIGSFLFFSRILTYTRIIGALKKGLIPMFIREYAHIVSDHRDQIAKGGGIHPYHELLCVRSGEFIIHWNGNEYKAIAPALFLFPPSSPHLIEQLSPRLDCWFVEYRFHSPETAPSSEVIQAWNSSQTGNLLERNESFIADILTTIQSLHKSVMDDLPKKYGDMFLDMMSCDIQKLMLQIEYYVAAKILAKNQTYSYTVLHEKWSAQSYIYDLIRYMEDNYMHDITLDELAKKSGYTPSYIIRIFKEMTNLTPLQYLYELRMNAATSYLLCTHMSVQRIAETIGFPNIHYFSRMFKKKFGKSPTDWKKNQNIG